jgi:hypothetical protein
MFCQVIGDEIYIEVLAENGTMELQSRPIPTKEKEWKELTNHLIELYETYRDGFISMVQINKRLSIEIAKIKKEDERIENIIADTDKNIEILDDIDDIRKTRQLKPYYGISGEYSYLGSNLFGIGFNLRIWKLQLGIVPMVLVDDSVNFGIGGRFTYWF